MNAPAAAVSPRPERTGSHKLLIGCAVGCGAVLLGLLIASGFGAYWFFKPGEQVATGEIVGEDSLAEVHVDNLADDPGTQALIGGFLRRMDQVNRRHQQDGLPPKMRWLADLPRRTPTSDDFRMFIPEQMTWTLERDPDDGEPHFVVAANPTTLVRPLKAFLSLAAGEDAARTRHGEHEILTLGQDAHLVFVGGTLLVSDSLATLGRALDRLGSGAGAGHVRGIAPPAGDWDAVGVVGNEDGMVGEVLADLLHLEPGGDGTESGRGELERTGADLGLSFGVDVVSADEIAGRTVLDCGSESAARQWLDRLQEPYEDLRRRFADQGLEASVEPRLEGGRVVTDLRVRGLEAAMDRMVDPHPQTPSP